MNQSSNDRPVVVGVSGDQPALLGFAVTMARVLEDPLRVVHCHSFQMGTADLYVGEAAGSVLHDAAQQVVDEARRHLAGHVMLDVEYVLRTEAPALAIEIESKNASVVVLGADDVALFDRVAGGEVARRAALHSTCPVVVVPDGTRAMDLTAIVVGVDTANVVEDALGFAFDLADRVGAVVRVVSALSPALDAQQRAWHTGRLGGHVAHWRKDYPDVDAVAEARVGDPLDMLVDEAAGASLMVVGHPNQPHRAPFFGRRVAAALLRTTPCAVAVVPAGRGG